MAIGMRLLWPAAMLALIAFVGTAHADVLTCDTYRTRLDEALRAGDEHATPLPLTLAFTSPVRGKRYGWDQGKGLSGSLNCGPADQFEEFGIELQFDRKQTFAADLKRLIDMQAASICALSSSQAPVCNDFGRAMLKDVLQQMGKAATGGVKTPSGLSDKTLFGPVRAELVSSSTQVSFLIGPGRGETMDATRQPLSEPAGKAAP